MTLGDHRARSWRKDISPTSSVRVRRWRCAAAGAIALGALSFAADAASPTVATDLDGDGTIELVTCHADGGTISIETIAPGRRAAADEIAVGAAARVVEVVDVNGDARRDLVVPDVDGTTLRILLATASGAFAAPYAIEVGHEPKDVAAGDLDGDGHPDLVVLDGMPGGVLVLRGDGRGGFTRHDRLHFDAVTGALDLGDLNSDGVLDVAVTLFGENAIFIAHGAGDGTLTRGATIPTPQLPRDITLHDVDGNGALDILVSAIGTERGITIFPGRGDGTVDAASAQFIASRAIVDFTIGDVTGDGVADLVAAGGRVGSFVGVIAGRGDGTFSAVEYLPTDHETSAVAIVPGPHGATVMATERRTGSRAVVRLARGGRS